MRYFLISDNHDTLVGMRLAGIKGVIAKDRESVRNAILQAMNDPSVGILLVNEKCAGLCPDLVNDLKLSARPPLLVEIPDRHGTGRTPDSITRYIRESIGIRI